MKGIVPFAVILIFSSTLAYGEMYKWVDEKGTLHFADDLSNVPEKYRPDAEMRKTTQETSAPETKGRIERAIDSPTSSPKLLNPSGWKFIFSEDMNCGLLKFFSMGG